MSREFRAERTVRRTGPDSWTALGHASDSYEDPDFRAHLLGGITWAARLQP